MKKLDAKMPQVEGRDLYRFNDGSGEVHRYSTEARGYVFLGDYVTYGIRLYYSEARKVKMVAAKDLGGEYTVTWKDEVTP